jgi:prepilin-type N-terminal cleavage/methylation domain-containing protein
MTTRGFTLIEVMVALVILAIVLLGTAQITTRQIHTAATSGQLQSAIELAESRVSKIEADPNYPALESLYVATETSFPTYPGFQRVTAILHVTSSSNDYKRATVTVTGPGLLTPVTRTVTRAAP